MTRTIAPLDHGFALLEALIAAAVMGFGLLAVARLQVDLMASSDLAKQRSEAVQRGEQQIERLRSFSQLSGYGGIASGTDSVTGSSGTYTRTWTIANSPIAVVNGTYPTYKQLTMTVGWTSRSNSAEAVRLSSIIAMYDPASEGQVVVPPAGTPTRKPKNRAINIPWPAVRLGDGTSAFHPPGSASGFAIVFDDMTGAVTRTCSDASLPGSDNVSGTPTDTSGWGCTALNGYLLAGYIGVSTSNPPPINFHIFVSPVANTSVSGTATLVGCYDDIGSSGTGTQAYAGYVSYACVIDAGSSHGMWSGTTTFIGQTFASPPTTVTWGTVSGTWKVCRYRSNGAAYPYVDVDKSLENQNYALVTGATECPAGTVQSFPPAP